MSTTTTSRAKTKLKTCPYCGQSLDRGAAEHLETALKQADHDRDVEVRSLVEQLVKDAKVAMLADRDREMAETREQTKEAMGQLEERVRNEARTREAAQARTEEIQAKLLEERQDRDAAVRRQVAEAEESLRRGIRREYDEQIGEQQQSRERLVKIIERLKEEKEKLQHDLDKAQPAERGDLDEARLVEILCATFADDEIKRNPERRGADVLHSINYTAGGLKKPAGLIVYECKDTKTWLNDFIEQARNERDLHHAQYVVLVSHAFPKKENHPLFVRDNVIVVDPDPDRVIAVASLLRKLVVELARARMDPDVQSTERQLYDYVKGSEFRHAVEFVREARKRLDSLLEKEQRSHQKDWAARKKLYQDLADRVLGVDDQVAAIIESGSVTKT